ncbi:MAG TPA: nucleoside triphosphate pyrophosphohydrolase [Candidatus Limnocylindria bacterium]|nr:nucleoside triphosphate pyrophosphohydrolase [Candidatus Limnocylindria bacterium]
MQGLLDELQARHGVRAHDGLQLLGVSALVRRPFDPGLPILVLPDGTLGTQVDPPGFQPPVLPGRHAHGSDPAALLRALYPADHTLLGLAGTPDTTVGEASVADLQAGPRYLPALAGELNVASPHGLAWLVARLRAPDGCPWDREQDHLSLRRFLLEEAYEVYDALEGGSTPALAEELGDLLLQVVLHSQYGAEAGVFDLADVQRGIMTKIVRRHPHVFGDVVAGSAAEVIRNWEQIKAGERSGANGSAPASSSADRDMPEAFAGLSRSLPALAYAQEMQERAASLGYDWPSVEGVLEKVAEEAAEVVAAPDETARREEFGDLLLVVVNLARRLGIDAEGALREASRKFAARFAHVERAAARRDVALHAMSAAELDELWQEAKTGGRR